MLALAKQITSTGDQQKKKSNITFHQSTAETSSHFLPPSSIDLVTAAQASHWFNYGTLWPDLARIIRPGGTVAFWSYTDPIIVSYPRASAILTHYAYSTDPTHLGPYWQQPGRDIVQDKVRAVRPPEAEWADVTRIEYEPRTSEGVRFMRKAMKLGEVAEFVRTWSAFHGWLERWKDDERRTRVDEGGQGDVVDELVARMREEEPRLRGNVHGWKDVVVELEWGTGLVLARRA